MGLALKKEPDTFRFDREAYLAWEAEQDGKHEYQAGEVVAMGGARQAHVLVSLRLASWLLRQLDGSPCRAYMSDMKLLIEAADAYYYPDVMVSCDPADRRAELAITAPSLIAEVLSDSTASRDRGLKFTHYRLIPSLRDYLIIDPEHRRIELYSRAEQGWLLREAGLGVAPPTAELPLDSLGLRLRCDDVFADLPELTTPPPFESDEPRDELSR
ncbi:MAG: Uma2 family endonuclease [Burkholderiales bacterium]|nr:Uma2 family endonuclease [Burkholderiales bacterium]